DPALQVKLLRVLQTRSFSRLGYAKERTFAGKLIVATNRDLASAMTSGGFRQDLYYRLCGDVVTLPSLRQRIADDPRELHHLILHIATRLVGDEAAALTVETEAFIERNLGADYAWPGNVRELEQCVRNIVIRRDYRPAATREREATVDPCDEIAQKARKGATADELLRLQCTWEYLRSGSYEAAAKKLDLDRRTVRAKVDADRLARWRDGGPPV
ncbi:MAG TPA: sigma 54-interacting transcriptional regulator, partial [Pirellulales bacterium]|nr:sigma 54-interacting transcriptional regulator [Pirellulales bacterium]